MFYEMKDSRWLSGDEFELSELRALREKVIVHYETHIIEGGEEDQEWEWLEDRLCDVCRYGDIGDFRFCIEEWVLLEQL